MIVAIDGPAGAGKSSVARALADRLGFHYLDTGSMYRALTWLALRDGVPFDDGARLAALAHAHPVDFGDGTRVTIDGVDVTTRIREPAIDASVPVVARHPQVRVEKRAVLKFERSLELFRLNHGVDAQLAGVALVGVLQ